MNFCILIGEVFLEDLSFYENEPNLSIEEDDEDKDVIDEGKTAYSCEEVDYVVTILLLLSRCGIVSVHDGQNKQHQLENNIAGLVINGKVILNSEVLEFECKRLSFTEIQQG